MQTINKFQTLSTTPNSINSIDTATKSLAQNFDCVRIGIIQDFFPENLTASVLIVNKYLKNLNADGTQNVMDFPLIYAKVCYCSPFETFPLKQGDECLLLFSDREIESWFINGGVNPEKYPRMHDKTDAIAICGLRSLPNMINILQNCLNLFYGNSNIAIADNSVTINSQTINLNGKVVINGQQYTAHKHSNGNQGNPTGGVITS